MTLWTAAEVDLARRLLPADAAAATGRTRAAVWACRLRHHFARPWRSMPRRLEAKVRARHEAGECAQQIAEGLRHGETSVRRWLKLWGLVPNRDTPVARAWRMAKYRAKMKRMGVGHPGELRLIREHLEVARAGWPAGCTRSAAEALAALGRGPQSVYELAGTHEKYGAVKRWAARLRVCVRHGWVAPAAELRGGRWVTVFRLACWCRGRGVA